ncbi:MAG: hypothetical protein WCK01_03025 [Candidatus Uhrbacteria bacterium]
MGNEFKLGVGAAHEFEITGRKTGWTTEDFTRLTQNVEVNESVLTLIRGQTTPQGSQYVIDCDSPPFVPSKFASRMAKDEVGNRLIGKVEWSRDMARLHQHPRLKNPTMFYMVRVVDLMKDLKDRTVLPANVLDFLMDHQELIPVDWQDMYVLFLGTVYRQNGTSPFVRGLHYEDDKWNHSQSSLEDPCHNGYRAAVL